MNAIIFAHARIGDFAASVYIWFHLIRRVMWWWLVCVEISPMRQSQISCLHYVSFSLHFLFSLTATSEYNGTPFLIHSFVRFFSFFSSLPPFFFCRYLFRSFIIFSRLFFRFIIIIYLLTITAKMARWPHSSYSSFIFNFILTMIFFFLSHGVFFVFFCFRFLVSTDFSSKFALK